MTSRGPSPPEEPSAAEIKDGKRASFESTAFLSCPRYLEIPSV